MAKDAVYLMHCSPRCTAKSKRSGVRCCNPAVKGWAVCRMHGARSGAKPGSDHPNFRHGLRTKEALSLRAQVMELVRESREIVNRLAILPPDRRPTLTPMLAADQGLSRRN